MCWVCCYVVNVKSDLGFIVLVFGFVVIGLWCLGWLGVVGCF